MREGGWKGERVCINCNYNFSVFLLSFPFPLCSLPPFPSLFSSFSLSLSLSLSVWFSTARIGLMAGFICWFVAYFPYLFIAPNYESISL